MPTDLKPEEDLEQNSRWPECTILLAEDEETSREALCECLRIKGYNVLPAENGLRALELARNWRGGISLLLTDLQMPHLGGLELSEQLLQSRPGTKVLFMSGNRDLGRDILLPAGVVLLQKPFRLEVLMKAIRVLLMCP